MNTADLRVYLVGGAVRDALLGLPVKDRDWVVVGATPQDLLTRGFRQVGADFPVFLHPQTGEEYALARTERKSGHGYHGFQVYSAPDVTLDDDLCRRDLTINAMAQAADGTLHDPYGGQQDLQARRLRHVSAAFVEDPLRVLRVARFAARFAPLGFEVASETLALMSDMVRSGELDHLVPERVWQETARALHEHYPRRYFEVLRACGALRVLLPELDRLFGIPQPEQHHPEVDTGEHVLQVLQQTAQMQAPTEVRYAALLHDLGKGLTPMAEWPRHIAHEARGLPLIRTVSERLKVPASCKELALLAGEYHTHVHRALELRPKTLLKVLDAADAWRRPERFEQFLQVCEADARGRGPLASRPYPQAQRFRDALTAARGVMVRDLVASGLQGAALGEAIRRERLARISAQLNTPSEPDAHVC